VKTGPNGDVYGTEVHRIQEIEGVQAQDRIDSLGATDALPDFDRLLATKQGLEHLEDVDQARFRTAGVFQLESFDELCELWVLDKA
jgi:hypothetical protein